MDIWRILYVTPSWNRWICRRSRMVTAKSAAIRNQAAVDAESQVIVAQTVTNNASDAQQLATIAAQIKQNTVRKVSLEWSLICTAHNLLKLRRPAVSQPQPDSVRNPLLKSQCLTSVIDSTVVTVDA
jgi:hypothetical protein